MGEKDYVEHVLQPLLVKMAREALVSFPERLASFCVCWLLDELKVPDHVVNPLRSWLAAAHSARGDAVLTATTAATRSSVHSSIAALAVCAATSTHELTKTHEDSNRTASLPPLALVERNKQNQADYFRRVPDALPDADEGIVPEDCLGTIPKQCAIQGVLDTDSNPTHTRYITEPRAELLSDGVRDTTASKLKEQDASLQAMSSKLPTRMSAERMAAEATVAALANAAETVHATSRLVETPECNNPAIPQRHNAPLVLSSGCVRGMLSLNLDLIRPSE